MRKVREIWDTNRSMRQKTNSHGFWCWCDMMMILEGQKCPICGRTNRGDKKKLKPNRSTRW